VAPRPPASERLDRDQVLAGALAIADAEGLDAVTLRRVAAGWNVTPMALYWHFKDKDALLDALVERMLAEIELPGDGPLTGDGPFSGDGPFTGDGLRAVLLAVLRVLRAHPALAAITPLRIMRSDAGIALSERVIGTLRAAGNSPVAAAQLSVILLNAVVGMVTNQPGELAVADRAERDALLGAKRARLKSLPPDAFPNLTETADYFLAVPDEEDWYERGVDFLVRGVVRL
jgi:TetR/AcrR family transcriptional regulator, tetracycline repressor protein